MTRGGVGREREGRGRKGKEEGRERRGTEAERGRREEVESVNTSLVSKEALSWWYVARSAAWRSAMAGVEPSLQGTLPPVSWL